MHPNKKKVKLTICRGYYSENDIENSKDLKKKKTLRINKWIQ